MNHAHPWDAKPEDRLSLLSGNNRQIIYFYEVPDSSTFRYRVFNMVEALNAFPDTGVSASWFSVADFDRMDRFLDRADTLVLCRARFGPFVDRILKRARLRKINVLFDVDDLIFDADYVPLIIDALGENTGSDQLWNNWFAYVGRHAATLKRCDGAITTNQYLSDKITEFLPRMAPRIVPNFLNRRQQERSDEIWDAKEDSNFQRDGRIHIGYFSGSPTHNRDFEVAASALARIMDEDPRVVFRIVGFLNHEGPLSRHLDRVEVFSFQDYVNLQRLIGEVEINIAPLVNNAFTNCKSELKYFEAAVVGTLTVASPTFNFRSCIQDGENGFLSNAQEWESKLRTAINAASELNRYKSLVKCARTRAEDAYGWNRSAGKIASAVSREPTSPLPISVAQQAP